MKHLGTSGTSKENLTFSMFHRCIYNFLVANQYSFFFHNIYKRLGNVLLSFFAILRIKRTLSSYKRQPEVEIFSSFYDLTVTMTEDFHLRSKHGKTQTEPCSLGKNLLS